MFRPFLYCQIRAQFDIVFVTLSTLFSWPFLAALLENFLSNGCPTFFSFNLIKVLNNVFFLNLSEIYLRSPPKTSIIFLILPHSLFILSYNTKKILRHKTSLRNIIKEIVEKHNFLDIILNIVIALTNITFTLNKVLETI